MVPIMISMVRQFTVHAKTTMELDVGIESLLTLIQLLYRFPLDHAVIRCQLEFNYHNNDDTALMRNHMRCLGFQRHQRILLGLWLSSSDTPLDVSEL